MPRRPPASTSSAAVNRANELTAIARRYGAERARLVYDRAGSMTTFAAPLAPGSAFPAGWEDGGGDARGPRSLS